ncbi:MAG: hypothetical protein R2835_04240 [Thermomicrobiales bacterium]
MSSSNSSDPKLLLPEWLRDGDTPLPQAQAPAAVIDSEPPAEAPVIVEQMAPTVAVAVAAPETPFSDRLALDTSLDPGQLVGPEDLPTWLGGLERTNVAVEQVSVPTAMSSTAASTVPLAIEEPEPYDGVDAPQPDVIDVEVNGWYVIAAGLGLIVLLAAALRLYLS